MPNTNVDPDSLDGTQCPANKLVITPQAPIKNNSTFTVVVNYTGRPGVHNDGDGTTEGWFRATVAASRPLPGLWVVAARSLVDNQWIGGGAPSERADRNA